MIRRPVHDSIGISIPIRPDNLDIYKNNLLYPETTYYWYRNRDKQFRKYFSTNENKILVYCNYFNGLIEVLELSYKPNEWILFIESSIHIHIGNKTASVPVAHSVQLNENYETLKN